jgi:hypothetical protein
MMDNVSKLKNCKELRGFFLLHSCPYWLWDMLRHDSDHSHPPSAKTKNMWSYNSIPSYLLRAWHSIKHNFTIISSGIYIVGLRKSIKKIKMPVIW